MKHFLSIVRDELNDSSYITVTGDNDELNTKNEFTLFMRYTENTLYTYSVTMRFDEFTDIVSYSVNYINDVGITSVFNSAVFNSVDELAQVVVCICAIYTNGCMIKFNDFDDFMNFDNVFCLIAPLFDDLPYVVEMHTVNNITVYSVCGARRDRDFDTMSTALRYFCTLCGYKIDWYFSFIVSKMRLLYNNRIISSWIGKTR